MCPIFQEEGDAQGTALGRDIAALKKQLVDRILASTKEELLLALKDTETAGNAASPAGNCHEEAAAGSQQIEGPHQGVPIEPTFSGTNDDAVPSSGLSDGAQQDQQAAHLQLQGMMAYSRAPVCNASKEQAAELMSMTDDLLSMTDDFLVLADSFEGEDAGSFFSLQDELLHEVAVYEENEKRGAPFLSQTSPGGSGTAGAGDIPAADGGSEEKPHAPVDSDWPQIDDVNADSTVANETLHHRDEEQKSVTFKPSMVTNPMYLHRYFGDDSQCSHRASSVDTSSHQLKTSFDQHNVSPALMTTERVQNIAAAPVAAEQSRSASAGDGGNDKAIRRTGLELYGMMAIEEQTCRRDAESATMTSKRMSSSLSSVGFESLLMAAQLREERLSLEKSAAETKNAAAIHKSASAPLDSPAEQTTAVFTERHDDGISKDSPLAGPEALVSSNDNGAMQSTTTGNPTADRIINRINALLGKRRPAEDSSVSSRGSSQHAADDQAELKSSNGGVCGRTADLPQSPQGRESNTASRQATDAAATALDHGNSGKTSEESAKDHPHKELSAGSEALVQVQVHYQPSHSTSFQPEPSGEAEAAPAEWQDTEGDSGRGSGREVFSLRDGVLLAPEETLRPALGPLETLASIPMYTEPDDLHLHAGIESHWETDNLQLSNDWVAKQQHGSHQESSAVSETLGNRQPSFEEPLKMSETPWEVDSQVLNDTSIVSRASVSTGDGALRRLLELASQREERLDTRKAPVAIAPEDEDDLLLSPRARGYTAVTAHVRELCMGKLSRYEDILDAAEADESYDLDDMHSGAGIMNAIGRPEELDQDLVGLLLQSPSDFNEAGHPMPVTPTPSVISEPHQVCQHICLSSLLPFFCSFFQLMYQGRPNMRTVES